MPTAFEARVNKSSGRRTTVPDIALTTQQKRLIRESFLKLEPVYDLVGQLFFMKLYRLDPSFHDRFGGTPDLQGRKFMAALKLGIISLNYEDGLAPTLRLMGIRHRQLGIKVRHYRMMAKALIWTLEQSLEKRFTRETKDAWSALLTQVTRTLSGSDAALLRSVGGSASA
jgi:hemoglobin-like flavoprotein